MNWSVIILGLVALSSVAIAENSYLIIVPKLCKVDSDNQLSVFIGAVPQPVEVKFELTVGQRRIHSTATVKPGETRNVTLTLPREFPVGAGELTVVGTGGVRFEEKRDVIVYDNSHVLLVQTSASTYRPGDVMDIRVVVTNEELMPVEHGEVLIEIYDANLKLVGEFPNVPVHSGLTEIIEFPLNRHCNAGKWLVSATVRNTTSSIEILVAEPVTPSFDLKAIFQRYLLRTDKNLRGVIEIDDDDNEPIFGRAIIAVNQITEQDVQNMMKERQQQQQQLQQQQQQQQNPQQQHQLQLQQQQQQEQQEQQKGWRTWKQQQLEIAGRVEINYDLLSTFNIDVTKALAIQVYIQVTELASGQERFIQHVIPIFTHDVIYDIRPLEFEAGAANEFEVIAKRPDGKPTKMEDLIVTVTMIMGNEQGKVQEEKSVEIKDFYTRGRNDIGFFNIEIPEACIGVLMTITPLSEDGKVRGYRTHAVPLMPTPRRGAKGAKLSIELLPSTNSAQNNPKAPVVSSQISTVGRTSNFYIQLVPSKLVEKFDPLQMSYVLLTNGRITHTGEFTAEPTKECRSKATRTIRPEEPAPPTCLFNGTLSIQITRNMMPYSTLLVYAFQPSFGINVAESYRFSVAGLFPSPLVLNATVVPYSTIKSVADRKDVHEIEDNDELERADLTAIPISSQAQGKTRVELSFTGAPGSTVGLNVIEYDGVLQGLSNEVTKERVLQYLTSYEQVPLVGMPVLPESERQSSHGRRGFAKGPDSDEHDDHHNSQNPNQPTKNIERHPAKAPKNPPPKHAPAKSPKENKHITRAVVSEEEEEENILHERLAYQVRYPIEKMIFGLSSSRGLKPVEGDDVYTTSRMGHLYGDSQNSRPKASYRQRSMKQLGQYDISVDGNDDVMATSAPIILKAVSALPPPPPPKSHQQQQDEEDRNDVEIGQHDENEESRPQGSQYGSRKFYEKMNSKLSAFSQEAFTFMQSGLSVITDFPSLRVPHEMRRENFTKIFSQSRKHSRMTDLDSFNHRDEARELLQQYIAQSDLTMMPPPIVLEEQARTGYYRSLFFNTTRIESQGVGKVVLPRTKPYSTWLATGFSLNPKSGLSVAEPIRLPTNQGLYVLGYFPDQVQVGEHVLLTYGINNYLGKDLNNVIVRIRASADFDLIEQNQPERIASTNGKDYTVTIPSLKTLGVETRHIILVPKRPGVVRILLEVECEFGGDYEILTVLVREPGIVRPQVSAHLYDLSSEKKSYGPVIEKITPSQSLRALHLAVSGTGLDRLTEAYTVETNTLVGIDCALIRLWNLIGLRDYLNKTSQHESQLFIDSVGNMSLAYQKLQLYGAYDGSYSLISDQGEQISSLYLTSLAFGALISPHVPVSDSVTINRTLTWLLNHQQADGSFDDNGPCFNYRFCATEFRREALTAIVLYSMTRHHAAEHAPEFVRRQLYHGEQSPVARAQRYLESRFEAVKSNLLTQTLMELALLQSPILPEQSKQKIYQNVRSRTLSVNPETGSRFVKCPADKFDDQLLTNALTLSIYAKLGDWKTTHDIGRFIIEQMSTEPQLHVDSILDAVFHNQAWLDSSCLFRRRFGSEKFSVLVDVTTNNGQKNQIKIDSSNIDMTQIIRFASPVNQITYTVSGSGFASVYIRQLHFDKVQQQNQQSPFQLTHEFTPMPWLSEITARTCLTYTPNAKEQQLAKDQFNRTIVVEVQIPSGMRLNLRQIGFFLSRVPEAMYFTFSERENKISFFLNVPQNLHGKPICLNWCLERLSVISQWAPIYVKAYDYLETEFQLARLIQIQLQPNLLGYSFVDAVHKARPTLEQLAKMQQQAMQPPNHN